MAFNVMDMIMERVTPDNLKAVAGMLGEDESKVSSALSGAAPAILGGLVNSLGKPEGKQAFEQQLVQASSSLPAAQTAQLAESFAKLAPDMEKAVAHAYAIPGVRDVLAGPVDSILRTLKVVSGT